MPDQRPCVWPPHRAVAPHPAADCLERRAWCRRCPSDVFPHLDGQFCPDYLDRDNVRRVAQRSQAAWLRDLSDGDLGALLVRLRRERVMEGHDDRAAWEIDWRRGQLQAAEQELRWRRQAAHNGGPPVQEAGWEARIERVKARIDVVELIARPLPSYPLSGRRWMASCPFHDDRHASLSIDGDKQLWHCFAGCGGGDGFAWVMRSENIEFLDALRLLERQLGIAPPAPPRVRSAPGVPARSLGGIPRLRA